MLGEALGDPTFQRLKKGTLGVERGLRIKSTKGEKKIKTSHENTLLKKRKKMAGKNYFIRTRRVSGKCGNRF